MEQSEMAKGVKIWLEKGFGNKSVKTVRSRIKEKAKGKTVYKEWK